MGYKVIVYGLFDIGSIVNIVEGVERSLNIKYFNQWGMISMLKIKNRILLEKNSYK